MKGLRKLGYWFSVLCLLTACNTLEIRSEQGAKSTSASPEPVAPLDGTSWRLVSLNGHDLIEDTRITLRFADGFVQGFAGCNAYRPLIIGSDDETHQYRATRDDSPAADAAQSGSLTIPSFIITEKDCPSPGGVMEQERTYVEALRNAAAYRVIEDRLEIDNIEGETILVFVREDE